MRVLIYARVSQDPRGAGRSVSEQERECRAWADREGWQVHRVIAETGSASRYARADRSGWSAVLRAIEDREVGAVLTWEASRAIRDLDAYAALREACQRSGVLWGYSGSLHDLAARDSRFRTGLDALLAEDEAARTSERVQRSVRATALAGRPHGRNLWGYRRVYDPETRALRRVEPDPVTGPLVAEAARRFLAGETCYAIAADWNRRNIPPRRPAFKAHRVQLGWTMVAVRELLTRPAYAGLRVHRGDVLGEADWPPLIPREDWNRIQSVLASRSGRRTRDFTARHLLSGIARCGVCGAVLRVGKQNAGRSVDPTTGKRATYATYVCSGTPGRTGFHVAMQQGHLDLAVTMAIIKRLEQPDFLTLLDESDDGADAERTALLAEIEEHQAFLETVRVRAAAEHRIDLLFDQEARVSPLIAGAEQRLRALSSTPGAVLDLAASGAIRDRWESLDVADRRTIVRALVAPTVHRSSRPRGSRGLDLDRIELVWH